jgi:hypothetical protein
MKLRWSTILLIYIVLFAFAKNASGQSINEFEIKAVFIYNFTQFIQWPENSFERADDPFVIGIVGENVFGKYLEEAVAGETYQSRGIVVKYYSTLKDVDRCQILYVGPLINVSRLPDNGPVLTIGERPEFMEKNGLLRFYKEGNKIRIEINQSAASAEGLVISSKLLRLATIYNGK